MYRELKASIEQRHIAQHREGTQRKFLKMEVLQQERALLYESSNIKPGATMAG